MPVLRGEHMLDRVRARADERVLITGVFGSGLIQLCRARGAIPYAIVGTGKEQAVTAIGAEAVIARETDDLVGAVNKATGGKPIDIVADLVAGPLFNDLLRILRPGAVTPRRCDRREGAQMIERERARRRPLHGRAGGEGRGPALGWGHDS